MSSQRALELFDEMRSQGLPAGVIRYNSTITACEKGEPWQRALELFEDMRSQGLLAGVIN